MGYAARMIKAKEEMRKLAIELSNQFPQRPTEEEWASIKNEVHKVAVMLKHEVYGEMKENEDRNNGWGDSGHEERMLIYSELKNTFHLYWKKLREKVEKKKCKKCGGGMNGRKK